jgi:hypothetical protein
MKRVGDKGSVARKSTTCPLGGALVCTLVLTAALLLARHIGAAESILPLTHDRCHALAMQLA